jgi:thiamine kinase-like enzyme
MEANGDIISFYKVGWFEKSKDRIKHEKSKLDFLYSLKIVHFKFPRVLDYYEKGNCLFLNQTPSPKGNNKIKLRITNCHLKALNELYEKSRYRQSTHEFLNQLRKSVDVLKENFKLNEIYLDSILGLYNFVQHRLNKAAEVSLVFSHGDFTPWNILYSEVELFIFDWEMGDFRTPLWDLFNFIYHKNILIKKFKYSAI